MRSTTRIVASALAASAVGVALMANDGARDTRWAVTPGQIADAKASGKPGVEIRPGRFAAAPVEADGAWLLPLKWLAGGLGAGLAVMAVTGRRRNARRG